MELKLQPTTASIFLLYHHPDYIPSTAEHDPRYVIYYLLELPVDRHSKLLRVDLYLIFDI